MSKDRVFGIVKGDPTENAPAGMAVSFNFQRYLHDEGNRSGEVADWGYFGSSLIAIIFSGPDGQASEGCAVLVSPGIAISAKHIFEDRLDELRNSNITVQGVSILENDDLLIWDILEFSASDSDIAILRLRLRSDFPAEGISCVEMTTRTPVIGEQIMFAGLRSPTHVAHGEPVGLQLRVGIGETSAIYPEGRDRVMIPHACIEVKCLTIGGMSGGPVFDKNGHLLGILTSSIEDEQGPSYCSLWLPMATHAITEVWLKGSVPVPTNLLNLANARLAKIIGLEAVKVNIDGSFEWAVWH